VRNAYIYTQLNLYSGTNAEGVWVARNADTPVIKALYSGDDTVETLSGQQIHTGWYFNNTKRGTDSISTEDICQTYGISSEADFCGFAWLVNNIGTYSLSTDFSGKTVQLTNDIAFNEGLDADATSKGTISYEWTPIGKSNTICFAGTFDGQGKTISGLYGNLTEDTNQRGMALFAKTPTSATIKNFKMENCYLAQNCTATMGLSPVVSRGAGTFQQIYVASDVVLENNAGANDEGCTGGIVGRAEGVTWIEECWFAGQITANSKNNGGMVGSGNDVNVTIREYISLQTGLSMDSIYIHATHSHTAPILKKDSEVDVEREYYNLVRRKIADVTRFALEDLKPAKMGWGIGKAPNISFTRRYRMKDGSTQTNPGIDNPDIAEPLGKVDDNVYVLRFDRENADSLVLVNFANHPDSVGGNKISADWPGFTRRTFEKVIDGTKCIVVNGAQGDINHVNVHPTGGYMNDIRVDFDGPRGYKHSEYLGRVVTAGVLQAYDKVKYVDVDTLKCKQRTIHVASNMPTPEQLPEAHRIDNLHNAGRDNELGYSGMMLTTVVAEAWRMVSLEHGPESYEMDLSAIAIGNIALVGIPGEPFAGIGYGLREAEGWELVLTTCITNGKRRRRVYVCCGGISHARGTARIDG